MVGITPAFGCAQNLIPNAGFEECEIECIGGVGYISVAEWETPECANGFRYFNTCNNPIAPYAGVPQNELGYSTANGGEAYCGIVTFSLPIDGGNVRRYGSAAFTNPLEQGETYCLRFYLSLADSSAYTTSALHAFLWYGLPTTCADNDTLWDDYAAVTYDLSAVSADGWTLMEGSFVADGGELSLTLGSFLYGEEIDTALTGIIQQPTPMAMYYIDDVYLGPCDIGVEEVSGESGLHWSPNPAHTTTTLQLELPVGATPEGEARVLLLDATGRLVLQQRARQNGQQVSCTLDVSALPRGLYYAHLRDAKQWLAGSKVVVDPMSAR